MTGNGIFLFLIVTLNGGKIEIVQIPGHCCPETI